MIGNPHRTCSVPCTRELIAPLVELQDKIFRRKRLSTSANFVHVYIEIWDKGIPKFNKFSMSQVKKNNSVIL